MPPFTPKERPAGGGGYGSGLRLAGPQIGMAWHGQFARRGQAADWGGMKAEKPVPEPLKQGLDGGDVAPSRTPIVFWGICDCKYDPGLPPKGRLRVLELGDGKTSRFSHHGREIKEKLDRDYAFEHQFIKRPLLTENKRLTHDRFVQEGFGHLRPVTGCYERRYEPGLAPRILTELQVPAGGTVVLKLCNRARGAGVVVAPAVHLDAALRRLLVPPAGEELDARLEAGMEAGALQRDYPNFEEQCLHWWSNECPVFLAEQRLRSQAVPAEDAPEQRFDGTLRVSFVLRRVASLADDADAAVDKVKRTEPFSVEWLGGYWKLPRAPEAPQGAHGGSPADLEEGLDAARAQTVSSFCSSEKRTAPVQEAHLQDVYAALTPALPRVFQAGPLSVQVMLGNYRDEKLLSAFALARTAASMRTERMKKADGLLQIARSLVPKLPAHNGNDLPERAVLSYIDRNLSICHFMQKQFDKALSVIDASLRHCPTNATAHFVRGRRLEVLGAREEAARCFQRAIALDPDFKLPYLALANVWLRLGRFREAVDAAQAGLARHPDAPLAQFIMGQACYQILRGGQSSEEERGGLCEKAAAALAIAKERLKDTWQPSDDKILQYFLAEPEVREELPVESVHPVVVHGWRP